MLSILDEMFGIPSTLLAFKIAGALAMCMDELFALREEDDV